MAEQLRYRDKNVMFTVGRLREHQDVRRVAGVIAALLVLAGCSRSGDHSASAAPFVLSGHVILAGGTGEHAVLHLTDDDTCYGLGPNSAFQTTTPLTIQTGWDMFATVLGPGEVIAPGRGLVVTGCQFPFAIADVPSRPYLYTVSVAGAHRTFTRAELAKPIIVRVAGRPVD